MYDAIWECHVWYIFLYKLYFIISWFYLQWTTVGPFAETSVELTLYRKCTSDDEYFGTSLSGQAVKWNWTTVFLRFSLTDIEFIWFFEFFVKTFEHQYRDNAKFIIKQWWSYIKFETYQKGMLWAGNQTECFIVYRLEANFREYIRDIWGIEKKE